MLLEVVVYGLSSVIVALVVEDVVLNLEGDADSLAKLAHTVHIFARSTYGQGAEGSAHTNKACRLSIYNIEVVVACGILSLSVLAL